MKIIIITHGTLAEGLVDSAKLIIGEQNQVKGFALTADKNINEFKNLIEKEVSSTSENIICLTDIVNGSPYNIASELTIKYENIYHICGVNLPMVLTAALESEVEKDELINKVIEVGKTSIFDAGSYLNKKLNEEL